MAERYVPSSDWKHRVDKSVALFDSLEARFGLLPEHNPPYLMDASDEDSDLIMDLEIQGEKIRIRIPHEGDPFIEGSSNVELIDDTYRQQLMALLRVSI